MLSQKRKLRRSHHQHLIRLFWWSFGMLFTFFDDDCFIRDVLGDKLSNSSHEIWESQVAQFFLGVISFTLGFNTQPQQTTCWVNFPTVMDDSTDCHEASKGGDDMKWQLVYLTDLWNDKAEASSSFSEVDLHKCLLQIFGHTLILTKTLQERKAKQLGLVFGHAISVSISDPKLTIFDQSDTSCITTSPWLSWEDLQFFDASHRWRLSGAISFSTDACGIPFDSMDVKRYQKKQDRDIWKQNKDGWRVYLTANRPLPWPFF